MFSGVTDRDQWLHAVAVLEIGGLIVVEQHTKSDTHSAIAEAFGKYISYTKKCMK